MHRQGMIAACNREEQHHDAHKVEAGRHLWPGGTCGAAISGFTVSPLLLPSSVEAHRLKGVEPCMRVELCESSTQPLRFWRQHRAALPSKDGASSPGQPDAGYSP